MQRLAAYNSDRMQYAVVRALHEPLIRGVREDQESSAMCYEKNLQSIKLHRMAGFPSLVGKLDEPSPLLAPGTGEFRHLHACVFDTICGGTPLDKTFRVSLILRRSVREFNP